MKHIWAKTESLIANKIVFRCMLNKHASKMILSASAFYNVFIDGELISYGPERTADGYSRIREIKLDKKVQNIEVLIFDYGTPSLDKDLGQPFFGCEVYDDNELIASTDDFKAYSSSKYLTNTIKYSFQRGYVERFDLGNIKEKELETFEIKNISLIKGIGDKCRYHVEPLKLKNTFTFNKFDEVRIPNYINPNDKHFSVNKDFLDHINGYKCLEYELEKEKSGLIKLNIKSETKDAKIFVVFDEYLVDGKWIYSRSSCNDLLTIDLDEFNGEIITSTVYSFKHLRILINKEVSVTPSLILIENDEVPETKKTNDEKIDLIIESARNTFKQNAVDIYTDCPGRERGGWLCDGYFLGIAEKFFTGKNEIERCFLENFIIGEYEEIEKGMIPMVFPSQEKLFIPNWSMWFVLELEQYTLRTGDNSLCDLAKNKVENLIKYFEKFENEYSLLENLNGWVFVEWSEAGTEDYVKGLNFPTNMLYSAMLEAASRLYKNEKYAEKARDIKENINKLAFNGAVYIDNAIRVNNKLELVKNHTSETCQYYALFFGLNKDEKFINFIKDELGPLRKENSYKEIAKSNSFIGNYLRFLWLNELGEIERIKKEAIDYFFNMASYSGTLWEKSVPNASCNHGFASSIAPILVSKNLIK